MRAVTLLLRLSVGVSQASIRRFPCPQRTACAARPPYRSVTRDARPCQAARSVIAPYRFPVREICFASAIQACALLADFMISYHISISLACWIASNKSDISNCIILYHISIQCACWILSSKSDILYRMILYHKIRPAAENFAIAGLLRREAISGLSLLPDARYEHPYIRSTAQNLTMRPGAPDAGFVRFARWRRIWC